MAFLCPVRIRRSKKKGEVPPLPNFFAPSNSPELSLPSPPGRITGSASIETLVRVGLEKEAGPTTRMVLLHDFSPCVDDELAVRKGDVVRARAKPVGKVSLLYREHDWAYVIDSKTPPSEGFIPFSYITSYLEPDITSSLPGNTSTHFQKTRSDSLYMNLYNFSASDENDLALERGAVVTCLNDEDPDWFWVVKATGEEGFVPSAFLQKLCTGEAPQAQVPKVVSTVVESHHGHGDTDTDGDKKDDQSRSGGTTTVSNSVELVMLYDYKAQAADDLSVKRGDWVHADLSVQTVQGWLWAYAPKQKKYGFIPRTYAKPPAMTSL